MLSEMLYADDLVLMSQTIEGFSYEFIKLNEVLESKRMKVNIAKTNVMVSGGIIKDGMHKVKSTNVRSTAWE